MFRVRLLTEEAWFFFFYNVLVGSMNGCKYLNYV